MLVTTEPANSGGKTFGPKYLAEQQSAVAVTTVRRSADSSYKGSRNQLGPVSVNYTDA